MPAKPNYQNRIELLQGTLDMLILRTLKWGPQHGHGIGLAIRAQSEELLQIETGSLYPALHRLEKQGWLASSWGTTANKQRAKYYRLTASGKKQLSSEHSKWKALVHAIARAPTGSPTRVVRCRAMSRCRSGGCRSRSTSGCGSSS